MLSRLRRTINRLNSDHVLIYVQAQLADVPRVPLAPGVTIRELDPNDSEDVELWLNIFNDAFARQWNESQFRQHVINERFVDVRKTLVLSLDGQPWTVASIGQYRRNPACGALHYISVPAASQGKGFGPQIAAEGCRQLSELGYTFVENQIPAHRIPSLKMHHRLGFRIKLGADSWNTPPTQSQAIQKRALRRTRALSEQW